MSKIAAALVLACACVASSAAAGWLHLAADARHSASATVGPPSVSAWLWSAQHDAGGAALVLEGASSPVVWGGRAYVNARHYENSQYSENKIVAIDVSTGESVFDAIVEKGVLDSRSSPCVDPVRGLVFLGSGSALFAVNAGSGAVEWSTPLMNVVVNASPVAADDMPFGRVLITDYELGGEGRLYCINSSPFNASENPHQPGEIVWSEVIGGTSGATPAYHAGVVYVATAADFGGYPDPGEILAFDVNGAPGSRLRWAVPAWEGFFGGVACVDGFVYAATYDFFGSGDNSTLFKVRASDGALQWTIPCERTSSIPVVRGDRVYLAAGLAGFGSAPKVQAFRDLGSSAQKLWDTWTDSGGQLVVGGWMQQPALAGSTLYVGRPASGSAFFDPATDLFLLDVTRTPGDPLFVRQQRTGLGSSPALAAGRLYSIGPGGVHAVALRGDYTGDGAVRGDDMQGFVTALLMQPTAAADTALGDFDGNGQLDAGDVLGFIGALLMGTSP